MIQLKLPMAPLMDPASINVYLLEGDPLTLVDTGFQTEAAWEALNSQLGEHGFHISDIQQLVLTHAHPDHFGQASRIVENGVMEVLAHADAAPRFTHKKADWIKANNLLLKTLIQTGAPEKHLIKRLTPQKGGQPLFAPVSVTREISGGDQITQGDEVWEVVDLPGHAPGIIGLYKPKTRDLITSDTLLKKTNSRPGLYMPLEEDQPRHPYMADYLCTLESISRMNISTAYPAHGEPFVHFDDLIRNWIKKHRDQAIMLAEPLKEGDKTAYEVWRAVFPRVLPFDPVKGLIEVITYLDLLIIEGLIQTYEKETLVYYCLI